MSTFAKLMTSGSRCQLEVAGELINHVSAGGETQSDILALPRNFSEIDREFQGEIVRVMFGVFTIRRVDLINEITRDSKIVWDSVLYNIDEQDELRKQTVYIDVSAWSPSSVRKGPEGFRRELT